MTEEMTHDLEQVNKKVKEIIEKGELYDICKKEYDKILIDRPFEEKDFKK